jgi:hypothetical protein
LKAGEEVQNWNLGRAVQRIGVGECAIAASGEALGIHNRNGARMSGRMDDHLDDELENLEYLRRP